MKPLMKPKETLNETLKWNVKEALKKPTRTIENLDRIPDKPVIKPEMKP